MTRKKREAIQEIHHPDGRVEVKYSDGSNELIDAQGNPLSKVTITEPQIEAWKKMPEEEALKEGIALFKLNNMDVPEARLKLEVLKFLCEIRGVMQPAKSQSQAVQVVINMGNEQKIIPVNAKVV